MTFKERSITLKQLPARIDGNQYQILLRELQPTFNVNHPRLVLDCSALEVMDQLAMTLILWCLEEAMKRNGDVRLAAVSHEAKTILEHFELTQLFRFFDSDTDALASFYRHEPEFARTD